jgi:ATP-binding cassette subfamily C protein LapB
MKELVRRLLARPGLAVEMLIASLLINVLALASTLYTMNVLNRYVSYGVDATLITLTVGTLFAALMEFCFRHARHKLGEAVSALPDRQMANAAYAILTKAKQSALDRLPSATLSEVMRGVEVVQQTYSASNMAAVMDVPFALLSIAVMYALHPALGVVSTICVGLTFLMALLSQGMMRPLSKAINEFMAGVQGLISSAIQGSDNVRAFNAASSLLERWTGHREKLKKVQNRSADIQGMVGSLSSTISTIQGVGVICVGAILAFNGELSVGALIGANILAGKALGPVSKFAQMAEGLAKSEQALVLLRDFGRLPIESSSGTALKNFQGRLELHDLAFMFPGSSGPLFESATLRLDPGSVLVITGPNGSGKTTLARLLLGIVDPTRGNLLADGVDLRQIAPEWWRRQIIYMPQEPTFIPGTLADNVRIANPDIDAENLSRVLSAAGLRKFIDLLPQGIDSPVIDGGRNLALGIRRRLALARAMATDGRLVVLDEPIEGLDAEGIQALNLAIREFLSKGKTIIALSHDPNVLRGAGAILDLGVKPTPRLTTAAPAAKPEENADG